MGTMLAVSKTSIVTGICCGKIDSEIDLHQFFEKLEINDVVIGAKFHGNTKGNISNNRSFFNQITLVVKTPEKTVNVKIFGNGNLHFSGIKTLKNAQDTMDILNLQLAKIRGEEKVEILVINDVLYDKKNYEKYSSCKEKNRFEMTKIYSYPDSDGKVRVIGFKKHEDHIIDKETTVIEGDYFVSIKFKDCIKKIFNKSGVEVGYYTYTSVYKRKNVILKGKKLIQESETVVRIDNSYGDTVGTITKTITQNPECFSQVSGEFLTDYSCLEKIEKLENLNLQISNINCKFTVSSPCGNFFNKNALNDILCKKYDLESYLNKESGYQGLSLKMYYPEESKKVSILFFRTGTVLMSGCVSKEEIVRAKKDFVKILEENADEILLKENVLVDEEQMDRGLTIWSLM
jgi:TATA-box binding protein (TBP) (component of TFIID and TFIIIB)